MSSNIQRVATSNQSEPFVIVVGDHKQNDQSFLVIDRKVVTETVIQDIPIILLAAFYMLNICYPSGLYNFYKFLELIFLNISHPIPPSVKILHTTLNTGTAKQ